MKFRTIILALLALAFIGSFLVAEDMPIPAKPTAARGVNSYGEELLESLQANGLVKLNRTTITNALTVNGSVIAQDATIGSIDIMGEAHLTHTTVQNGGTILGYLQTHHANIQQPLTLNGQKAVFSSTKLSDITIRKMDAFKGKQIIELRQKTVVDGSITFESGKGEVHLYPGSQIIGPVKGGKVVRKN